MGKLYIDITELVGWKGKITGVPRVMDEISRRFSTEKEIVFVTWRPEGYTEISYPLVQTDELAGDKAISLSMRVASKVHAKSRVIRKIVRTARNLNNKSKTGVMPSISLKRGDILFVLADWHGGDPSFIKYLQDMHELGVSLVQMVYDMLPIVTPQYSGHSTEMLKNYSTKIYPICDLIFSISEHTKKDITKWLTVNKLYVPPIVVVRLGDDFSRIESKKPSSSAIPDTFVLCVGTIEARKNHVLLYYAYKLAFQKNLDLPPLVIVGRVGWLAEDICKIMQLDPEVKDKFIFLHSADDNELAWLYENCQFSVYPSFYEGWGLPIAESIAHKKPVVASNTSSMPEIAGDLIDYFNPASPEECLERIIDLTDDIVREQAIMKISKYKPYSWDNTYRTVNDAIKGLK
jgi:hypothetical protein